MLRQRPTIWCPLVWYFRWTGVARKRAWNWKKLFPPHAHVWRTMRSHQRKGDKKDRVDIEGHNHMWEHTMQRGRYQMQLKVLLLH